jgi:methylmalonyl-CoA mutase
MDAGILHEAGFEPVKEADWQRLALKALKGASFEETLIGASDEGIEIRPLYRRVEGAQPLAHAHARSLHAGDAWTVSQRRDDPDIARARAQMAEDLENGATGISLVFSGTPSAYGTGLSASAETAFTRTARARAVSPFSLRLDAGVEQGELATTLMNALEQAGAAAGPVHFGLDPQGLTLSGVTDNEPNLTRDFKTLAAGGLSGTILNADGRLAHNAGAGEALELAIAAASLAASLRTLDAAGVAPETVFSATGFSLAADQDQFLTTAKLRAARLIHAKLQAACGISEPLPLHIHAETSWRMLTRLDPETNILRNTIAAFSAGTAGADEITVLPHTLALGLPDPLARRIARNTQVLLITESNLAHVADPAAGAGGIEALTEALAERAWAIFADIEKKGGLAAASGDIRAMIEAARQERRTKPIVGTTLFPAKAERPVTVLAPLQHQTGATGLAPTLLVDLIEGAAA